MFEFLWGAKKIKKTLRYKTAIFDLPWSLCLKVDIGYKTFILPLSINPALSHTNMLFAPHLVCWDLVITFRRIVPLLCILISQIRVQHAAVILHNQTWRQSSYSKLPVRLRFPFRSWGSEFSQNIHMLSSRGHLQPLKLAINGGLSPWNGATAHLPFVSLLLFTVTKETSNRGVWENTTMHSEHRHWLMYAKWE